MRVVQAFLDYFRYSEGNVQVFYVCCLFSVVCILLLLLSIPLGRVRVKPSGGITDWNAESFYGSAPEQNMYCPQCGAVNEAGAAFCNMCGSGLR